jgi:hypothetical protein
VASGVLFVTQGPALHRTIRKKTKQSKSKSRSRRQRQTSINLSNGAVLPALCRLPLRLIWCLQKSNFCLLMLRGAFIQQGRGEILSGYRVFKS